MNIDAIIETHRKRQALHRAEKSLTLQIKAMCRRLVGSQYVCSEDDKSRTKMLSAIRAEANVLYDAIFDKAQHDLSIQAQVLTEPFIRARGILESDRKQSEKHLEKLAKELPVASWVSEVKGFGIGSLAAIVGETGDLSNYATHSRLWKRLGLAVIDGGRQRRVSGSDAIKHGYCASRRSVMWNVGQCIFKSQSARINKETGEIKSSAGQYRVIYDARKVYEADRVETKKHAHNRAMRYLEKRVVRDLWKAWNSEAVA